MEVGDDLAARQRPQLAQRQGERLGHRAADLERGLGGHGGRGVVEVRPERGKPRIALWSRRP